MIGTMCSCWDCKHPDQDNAGIRTLHTLRHVEFAERMDDIELGRWIAKGLIERPVSVPVVAVRKA